MYKFRIGSTAAFPRYGIRSYVLWLFRLYIQSFIHPGFLEDNELIDNIFIMFFSPVFLISICNFFSRCVDFFLFHYYICILSCYIVQFLYSSVCLYPFYSLLYFPIFSTLHSASLSSPFFLSYIIVLSVFLYLFTYFKLAPISYLYLYSPT